MLKFYQYPQCGTCKKALKWLDSEGIKYQSIHIVDSPPSQKELKEVLNKSALPLRKLFNTSGQVYREGGYKDKLPNMSEKEAIEELASHGKLIKRPFLIGKAVHLVGFNEQSYEEAFR